MSILNRLQPEEVSQNQRRARQMRRATAELFSQLKSTWERNATALWMGDTAGILIEIGTDAVELFRVSAETVKFLEALQPDCTADVRALLRPYTAHPDGTITLNA